MMWSVFFLLQCTRQNILSSLNVYRTYGNLERGTKA